MNETIFPIETRIASNSQGQPKVDSTSIFRLCLEIYSGKKLSDDSKSFLDSMIPDPALVLLICGDKYLHPEEFEMLPVQQLRESVIENRTGIFHRKLNRFSTQGEQRPELCASLLGQNKNNKDVAVGIFYPGGWDRYVISEDNCYNQLTELQKYYFEFTESKAISKFVDKDDAFHYLIDLSDSTVIAESLPNSGKPGHNKPEDTKVQSDKIIRQLLENGLQSNPDSETNSHFKNVEITNFTIRDLRYAMISLCPKLAQTLEYDIPDNMFRIFVHKLNNKLGALQTATDQLMLEEGGTVDVDDLTLAEIIQTEGENIGHIVRRMGEYYRSGKLSNEEFDLNKLLREIADHFQKTNEFQQINFVPHNSEIVFSGDYSQLRQAFVELIENGLNASGGVSLEITKTDTICVSVYNDLSQSRLDELLSERFDPFEPFNTFDHKRTGMGLSIARKIIRDHQGQIEIKNENNTGVLAKITLPAGI